MDEARALDRCGNAVQPRLALNVITRDLTCMSRLYEQTGELEAACELTASIVLYAKIVLNHCHSPRISSLDTYIEAQLTKQQAPATYRCSAHQGGSAEEPKKAPIVQPPKKTRCNDWLQEIERWKNLSYASHGAERDYYMQSDWSSRSQSIQTRCGLASGLLLLHVR